MNAKQVIAVCLTFALVSLPAPAMASGPGGHGPQDGGGFGGLPDQAMYGICTAFDVVPDVAQQAPPFSWLTPDSCQDVDRPDNGTADDRAA